MRAVRGGPCDSLTPHAASRRMLTHEHRRAVLMGLDLATSIDVTVRDPLQQPSPLA